MQRHGFVRLIKVWQDLTDDWATRQDMQRPHTGACLRVGVDDVVQTMQQRIWANLLIRGTGHPLLDTASVGQKICTTRQSNDSLQQT